MTQETESAESDDSTDSDHIESTETDESDGIEPSDSNAIEPAEPDEFGLVQVWWGDGKGKTTAALGMGFRAAGHGYRVHLLQFMKGGAGSVEDVRGEYAAIEALPTFTYENTGEYGWHGFSDGSDDDEHAARAKAALARAREVANEAGGVGEEGEESERGEKSGKGEGSEESERGEKSGKGEGSENYHMLILDEVLYAANRGLLEPEEVREFVESKPQHLELVLTGGHDRPDYVTDLADLVTHVEKEKHPIEAGQGARKGTEY